MIYILDDEYYTFEQLKKGYKAITGLNNANDLTEEELFNYMKDALKEDNLKDLEIVENEIFFKYPKATEYVIEKLQHKRKCNCCNSYVLESGIKPEYPYQCMYCDEDMYSFETHIVDDVISEDDLIDLIDTTNAILCLDEKTE